MKQFKPTGEQQNIIDSRQQNILVSASAGTGKTRVMIERIIKLLEDGESLSKMLIVTFTEKAAMEMRKRLEEGLKDRYELGGKEKFLEERLRLQSANISTLHGYCTKMIHRYAYMLGLSQDMKVLEDMEILFLKEEAMDKTMEKHFQESEEDFIRLMEYFSPGNDTELRAWVEQMDDFLELDEANEKYLSEWIRDLLLPLPNSRTLDGIVKSLCSTLTVYTWAYKDMIESMQRIDESGKRVEILSAEREALLQWIEEIKREREIAIRRGFPVKFKQMSGKVNDSELAKSLNNDRTKIKKKIKTYIDNFPSDENWKLWREQKRRHLSMLFSLAKEFRENYRILKENNKAMDFNDMEKYFLSLLEKEEVKKELKEETKWIFFDEYQDANPVQEQIVEKLSDEAHLFFVGDVKQSIYAFRGSRPQIFKNRFKRYTKEKADGIVLPLSQNFRSKNRILSFVNSVFSVLMTEDFGGLKYDHAYHRFNIPEGENEGAVHLVYQQFNTKPSEDEVTQKELEAFSIALKIKEMVESGEYTYGDFGILQRNSSFKEYESVFRKMGIPYYSENEKVGYDRGEVDLFFNLLRTVENPKMDLPLIASLLSFVGGMDEEDLWRIRTAGAQELSFSSAFWKYEEEGETLRKKELFCAWLSFWQKTSEENSLSDFLWKFFEESGIREYFYSIGQGKGAESRLKSILHAGEKFERMDTTGLFGFLKNTDRIRQTEKDHLTAEALSEKADVVRFMTMHKSKGLEFPVVFLVGNHRDFLETDYNVDRLLLKKDGIAIPVIHEDKRIQDPELSYFKNVGIIENKEEEMRLLYVALTRGEKEVYFYMEGSILPTFQRPLNSQTLNSLKNYQDWILHIVLRDHRFRTINPYADSVFFEEDMEPDWILEDGDRLAALWKDYEPTPDVSLEKSLLDAYQALTMPKKSGKEKSLIKRTVTEVAHEKDTASTEFTFLPPQFLAEQKMDAASKGTLFHRIFEYLPMDGTPVEETLDYLLQEKLINEEEKKLIPVDRVEKFLASDLGKEIAASPWKKRELSFTMQDEGLLIDGQVDLVFERGEGLVIVDFKSDRRMRKGFYDRQLNLYAKALSKATGKKVIDKIIWWIIFAKESHIR